MMYRKAFLPLIVLLILIGLKLLAQQKAPGKPHVFIPPVYLGHSDLKGGPIKKDLFNSLLKQGISCHDSAGNKYRIVSFDFGYSERRLYEDSVGNMVTMMDYSAEYCVGDTLGPDISKTRAPMVKDPFYGDQDSSDISKSIYERVKPGDTVYFYHVVVAKYLDANTSLPDSLGIKGGSMKFYFVK
jgi:hypothetical protein